MSVLRIIKGGPHMSVQDAGRIGHIAQGIAQGGAADPMALAEAAALFGTSLAAGIEMAGAGGTFEVDQTCDIALTGAPMRAELDGRSLRWGASHVVRAGQRLTIGGAAQGVYGYLTPRGGVQTDMMFASRSAHIAAGIGAPLNDGAELPIAKTALGSAKCLSQPDRFKGGTVRFVDGPQTHLFDDETLARLCSVSFVRGARGNRQGVEVLFEGSGFVADAQLSRVSDFVIAGDIQMTGDGRPYVLLTECQTIGGYPRIGTVIPADIPRIAQAAVGTELRFERISLEQADLISQCPEEWAKDLRRSTQPLLRDPADMHDLLGYQLIDGMITGDEEWL